MTTLTQRPAVVVGARSLQAFQSPSGWRLADASAYAKGLLQTDAVRWLGVEVDPRLDVPAALHGLSQLEGAGDQFGPAPSHGEPIVYHVVGVQPDAGMWDLVPRWAMSPKVALVVTIFEAPAPSARAMALLHSADAVVTGRGLDSEHLGIPRSRVHMLDPERPDDVQSTIDAYDAALRRRATRVTRRVKGTASARLAVVTPLPPARSGIALYSTRLIAALARQVGVDVYREDDRHDNPLVPHGVRCFPARGFQWRWELAPRELPPLYCIGNSGFHMHAWRALMRQRGDVLLHDVKLEGLYRVLTHADEMTSAELGVRMRLIEGRLSDSLADPDLLLVGEVVDRARRIYVHTEIGREMVLGKCPARANDVFVVPFAMPTVLDDRRPADPPVIAAFGYLQCGRLLLDSATEILAARPATRLRVIGGGIFPDELGELRRLARGRGVDGRIEFLGWSDTDRYELELQRATIALQLRSYHHGEMSAAVADCLAAGLPTVVNDFGTLGALPRDVVMRVSRYPTPREVANAVISLLDDATRRAELSAAAAAHARAHSADHAARALLRLMSEPLPGTP